ncbi:MAG: S-layer protein domain-containing protein, partial [Methanotrichaceae archaeon]
MKNIALICILAIIVVLVIIREVPAQEIDIPSDIHDLSENEVTWNSYTFPGFYYDIDNDIGTETLTFRLSDISQDWASAVLSDQPDVNGNRGAVYTTEALPVEFSFGPWGQYELIGFLGGDYFAAYDSNATDDMNATGQSVPLLYDKSDDRNLMDNGQISEILIDDDTEQTFNSSNPLELEEGYNLSIKSVDADSNKVYVELSKNGQVVDSKVIQPSIENANIGDETYYYKKDIGNTKGIVIIAVHFKNVFDSANNIATVDGVFQISDTPTSIATGQQYDKMSIRSVDPTTMTVVMDNKDNPITLSKDKDIKLMDDFY